MIGLLSWHPPPSKRQEDSKNPDVNSQRNRKQGGKNPGNIGGGDGRGRPSGRTTRNPVQPSGPAQSPDATTGSVISTILPSPSVPPNTDNTDQGPNQGTKTGSGAIVTSSNTELQLPPFVTSPTETVRTSRTRTSKANVQTTMPAEAGQTTSQSDGGSSGPAAGTLAAAVVVPIVVIALLGLIFFFLRRRRLRQRANAGRAREVKEISSMGDMYGDGPAYRDESQMPRSGDLQQTGMATHAFPQAGAAAAVPPPNGYYGSPGDTPPLTSAMSGMPHPRQHQPTPRSLQPGQPPPPPPTGRMAPDSGSYLLGEDIGGKSDGTSPFGEDGEGGERGVIGDGGEVDGDDDDAVSNISASEEARMPADQMSAVSDLSYQGDLRPGREAGRGP